MTRLSHITLLILLFVSASLTAKVISPTSGALVPCHLEDDAPGSVRTVGCSAATGETLTDGEALTVVEFNCENLFDFEDDSLKEDEAFLPSGSYHWTPARYWKKINNIGREILSCGEQEDGATHSAANAFATIPDLVALCEVENDSVLRDLTKRSLLRNAGYEYFITQSQDSRGIDVALLYSPMTFRPLASRSIRITPLPNMRPTRDILYVKGMTQFDTLHIFVVHAPSRSGGEIETRPNRMVVAKRLVEAIDSIYTTYPSANGAGVVVGPETDNATNSIRMGVATGPNIIVMGDFNDYSTDRSITFIEEHGMEEISRDVKGRNDAKGTYKYQGEWGSLDHIFLSPSLMRRSVDCRIGDAEFLLTKDEIYGGVQPHRNFIGPKWKNGFSDHLPLVLRLGEPL